MTWATTPEVANLCSALLRVQYKRTFHLKVWNGRNSSFHEFKEFWNRFNFWPLPKRIFNWKHQFHKKFSVEQNEPIQMQSSVKRNSRTANRKIKHLVLWQWFAFIEVQKIVPLLTMLFIKKFNIWIRKQRTLWLQQHVLKLYQLNFNFCFSISPRTSGVWPIMGTYPYMNVFRIRHTIGNKTESTSRDAVCRSQYITEKYICFSLRSQSMVE